MISGQKSSCECPPNGCRQPAKFIPLRVSLFWRAPLGLRTTHFEGPLPDWLKGEPKEHPEVFWGSPGGKQTTPTSWAAKNGRLANPNPSSLLENPIGETNPRVRQGLRIVDFEQPSFGSNSVELVRLGCHLGLRAA